MPEILRLGKLRQEDDEFKTSLAYTASLKPWVYSASVYSAVKWVDRHCLPLITVMDAGRKTGKTWSLTQSECCKLQASAVPSCVINN